MHGVKSIWFAAYTPAGIAWVLASNGQTLRFAIISAVSLILVNVLILLLFQKETNGRELRGTRYAFCFLPPVIAAVPIMIWKDDFRIHYVQLNYVFNMIYAGALFGFWLPCDRVPDEDAKTYYEEYRQYLWPAIFLTVVSFVSGVWGSTLPRDRPSTDAPKVEDFLFLTYLGLGFGSSIPLVFSHINTFRLQMLDHKRRERPVQGSGS